MEWNNIGRVLTKLAPMIGGAVGGPLAGTAITAIEGAFGLKSEGPLPKRQDAAVAAVSTATPEQLLALKQADQAFAAKMAELGIADVESLAKLGNDDRASARAREIAVRDRTPMILAFLVVVFAMIVDGVVIFHGVPKMLDGVTVGRVLGTVDAVLMLVLSYYFGSSMRADRERADKIKDPTT